MNANDELRQTIRKLDTAVKVSKEIGRLNKAVDEFAEKMKLRLASKARAGYTGWDDAKACTRLDFETRLMKKAQRGSAGKKAKTDLVDIANFAMMLERRLHEQG
jgi:hypothetical protein